MAGKGFAPKPPTARRNFTPPQRGEWKTTEQTGWQHGDIPKPPSGLLKASRETWDTWMRAWFAAHWTPEDLPGLNIIVTLYDQVERGEYQRANELRLQMDTYGITPKGQQDRRWAPPREDSAPTEKSASERRRRLKVV